MVLEWTVCSVHGIGMDGCYGVYPSIHGIGMSISSWYGVRLPTPRGLRIFLDSNFSRFKSWFDNPEPWDDDYGVHNQKTDFVQHHHMSSPLPPKKNLLKCDDVRIKYDDVEQRPRNHR